MKGENSWPQQQNLSQNKTWPWALAPLGLQRSWMMLSHAFGQPSPCLGHKAVGWRDRNEGQGRPHSAPASTYHR